MLLDAGWLPNLRDGHAIRHSVQPFVAHLLAAAQEIGIPQDTCARNIFLYQLIVDCVKSPQAGNDESTSPFTVVVPVNRSSQFELNVARSPGLLEIGAEIIAVQGAQDAAHALTTGAGGATKRWILYCHQDVYIPKGSGQLLSRLLESIPEEEARYALIGFAGLGIDRGGRVSKSGLVVDRTSLFDHPEAAQAVSLDEFAIVIGRDSVHQIDPSLGWHAWGTDLCLAARHRHRAAQVRIARVPMFHNSFNDARLPPEFDASIRALLGKYPKLDVVETLNGTFTRQAQ